MAVLSTDERKLVRTAFVDAAGKIREPIAATKPEFDQILAALDDQLDSALVSLNSAIPAGVRSKLTQRQKLRLLMFVFKQRFEVS